MIMILFSIFYCRNYWYNWVIVLPAELSAAAVLINYWNTSINNAVWIIMCLVVTVAINMLGARAYGEAEYVLMSLKKHCH